jgi:hypothetical protein
MKNTDGAEPIGKILKKPKSLMTELLTEAEAFVSFLVDDGIFFSSMLPFPFISFPGL